MKLKALGRPGTGVSRGTDGAPAAARSTKRRVAGRKARKVAGSTSGGIRSGNGVVDDKGVAVAGPRGVGPAVSPSPDNPAGGGRSGPADDDGAVGGSASASGGSGAAAGGAVQAARVWGDPWVTGVVARIRMAASSDGRCNGITEACTASSGREALQRCADPAAATGPAAAQALGHMLLVSLGRLLEAGHDVGVLVDLVSGSMTAGATVLPTHELLHEAVRVFSQARLNVQAPVYVDSVSDSDGDADADVKDGSGPTVVTTEVSPEDDKSSDVSGGEEL